MERDGKTKLYSLKLLRYLLGLRFDEAHPRLHQVPRARTRARKGHKQHVFTWKIDARRRLPTYESCLKTFTPTCKQISNKFRSCREMNNGEFHTWFLKISTTFGQKIKISVQSNYMSVVSRNYGSKQHTYCTFFFYAKTSVVLLNVKKNTWNIWTLRELQKQFLFS